MYKSYKPPLDFPCLHYLMLHCKESPVGNYDGPKKSALVNFDDIRTMLFYKLNAMYKNEDSHSRHLKIQNSYRALHARYFFLDVVKQHRDDYFGMCLDRENTKKAFTDTAMNNLISLMETNINTYTQVPCQEFILEIFDKDTCHGLCSSCPFCTGGYRNHSLEQKYKLLCFMLSSIDNFNSVVRLCNHFHINLRDSLFYMYDVRLCGAVNNFDYEPLFLPFFQIMYDICSDTGTDLNGYADESIDLLKRDLVLSNDELFAKLIHYIQLKEFPYSQHWIPELKYGLTLENDFYVYTETSCNKAVRNSIKWLEHMFSDTFLNIVAVEDNFSYLQCLQEITRNRHIYENIPLDNYSKFLSTNNISSIDFGFTSASINTADNTDESALSSCSNIEQEDFLDSLMCDFKKSHAQEFSNTNTLHTFPEQFQVEKDLSPQDSEIKTVSGNASVSNVETVLDNTSISNVETVKVVGNMPHPDVETVLDNTSVPNVETDKTLVNTHFSNVETILDNTSIPNVETVLDNYRNYLDTLKNTTPLSLSRMVYFSPVELLLDYPLDITQVNTEYAGPVITGLVFSAKKGILYVRDRLSPVVRKPLTLPALPLLSNDNTTKIPQSTPNVPKSTTNSTGFIVSKKKLKLLEKDNERCSKLKAFIDDLPERKISTYNSIGYTDNYYSSFNYRRLTSVLPDCCIPLKKLHNFGVNLSNPDVLQYFESCTIKSHEICIEACYEEKKRDVFVIAIPFSSMIKNHPYSNKFFYFFPNECSKDLLSVMSSYISKNSYRKTCFSSDRLYAMFKKYNIKFRNICSIFSALSVLCEGLEFSSYRQLYTSLYAKRFFSSELPDLMTMMKRNSSFYYTLLRLIETNGLTDKLYLQQLFDVAIGCSYVPSYTFPVSRCTLYDIVDFGAYYMRAYSGLKSLESGYFIQIEVNHEWTNANEDFSLIPMLLIVTAYKGLFRKYKIAISSYGHYKCTLFVEDDGFVRLHDFLMHEAVTRARDMFPDRDFEHPILNITYKKSDR